MNNKEVEKKVNLDILIRLSKLNNFDINKSLVIKKYIPFEKKIIYIEDLVNKIIETNGSYNSITKYYEFTMTIINIYTNLELNNSYEEYDKLITSDLLNIIFKEIESEYFDFKEFFEMRFNDKLREIYSNKK